MSTHTYMIKAHRMAVGHPLTLSGGERIIAVLETDHTPGLRNTVDLTVLVELPRDDSGEER